MTTSYENLPDSLQNCQTQMESISKVAIRNSSPDAIDPNDPEQRKLIDNLKRLQANIWEYSDNQPSFLATLHQNNPTDQRRAIESIIVKSEAFENPVVAAARNGSQTDTISAAGGEPGTGAPTTTDDSRGIFGPNAAPQRQKRGVVRFPKGSEQHHHQQLDSHDDVDEKKHLQLTSASTEYCYQQGSFRSARVTPSPAPPEMKMIIKKTLELIIDMTKSVELAYHAIRASARFLTYPTPSVPSDNYIFGHAKGWIWLIYKSLANFDPSNSSGVLTISHEMSKLASQARQLSEAFSTFTRDLNCLYDSVKKEAKVLKSQNLMWAVRIEAFIKFAEEINLKHNLLVDIREDKPFSSDWIFEPHPSITGAMGGKPKDFFHFQWVKTKVGWDASEFEVRSDYSTRWHPFSDFSPDLQLEMISFLVQHLTAVLEECTSFVRNNVRLSFDSDEIKCLKFAVAEILSGKKSNTAVDCIADMTKKLFQDLALLDEISLEMETQLEWISNMIEPCYLSIGKRYKHRKQLHSNNSSSVNNKTNEESLPLPPLLDNLNNNSSSESITNIKAFSNSIKKRRSICPCIRQKSHKDFLELYGDPMEAVFLRTPITQDIVSKFFPKEQLFLPTPSKDDYDHTADSIHLPTSARINAYGVSDGYKASIFDQVLGRDPPLKKVKRLPKFRRSLGSGDKEESTPFELSLLVQFSSQVIRNTTDGEVDTEIYLRLFDQIKKFLQAHGTLFNFILSEMTEKLENLDNKLYTGLTDHFESLEKIVEHETSTGIVQNDPWTCGTRAFRRINMALIFFTGFLAEINKLNENDGTAYPCKMAYYKSYARYHSWFVQKTSAFSIYSLPNKKMFYGRVCPDMEVGEIDKVLEEFIANAIAITDHCETVFKKYEVSDL